VCSYLDQLCCTVKVRKGGVQLNDLNLPLDINNYTCTYPFYIFAENQLLIDVLASTGRDDCGLDLPLIMDEIDQVG
jgi:hypothetical protein